MLKFKSILISTLIFLFLFSSTGCTSKSTKVEEENTSPPRVINPDDPYSLEDLKTLTPEQIEKVLNKYDYINKFQAYNLIIVDSFDSIEKPGEHIAPQVITWGSNTADDLRLIWNTMNDNRLSVPISISKQHNEFMETTFDPFQEEISTLLDAAIMDLEAFDYLKAEEIYNDIAQAFSKYTAGLNSYTNFLIDLLEN